MASYLTTRKSVTWYLVLLTSAILPAAGHAATVAYWRFETVVGGNQLPDSSGNGNTATLLNQARLSTDVPNQGVGGGADPCVPNQKSLSLNSGTQDAAFAPDSPTLRPSTGLTIECWVKPNPNAWVVVGKQIGGDVANSYLIELHGDTSFDFILGEADGTMQYAWSYTGVPSGVWSHLAATWDGTTMLLYLNASLVAAAHFTGPIGYDSNAVIIGADNDGYGVPGCCFFDGWIDELRISDVPLDPPQFLQDCQPPTPVRVASWGQVKNIYR